MSTKRQPSKQKRQTQNQRQRAALEARRANAAAAEVSGGQVGASPSSGASSSGPVGSVLSRLRGAVPKGPASRATGVAATSSASRVATADGPPVGHRAALSALLAAVAAATVGALLISIPVDAGGEPISTQGAVVGEWVLAAHEVVLDSPDATASEVVEAVDDWMPNGEEPYGKAYWPISLGLLLPVVGAALAFRAVSQRAAAKVVNRTMYVTLFGTLLNTQVLFIFLPTIIGVGIAAFQVRKAELATVAAAGASDVVAAVDDDDEVIDVEEAIDAEEAVESDHLIEAEAIDAEEAHADDVADADDQRSV